MLPVAGSPRLGEKHVYEYHFMTHLLGLAKYEYLKGSCTRVGRSDWQVVCLAELDVCQPMSRNIFLNVGDGWILRHAFHDMAYAARFSDNHMPSKMP